MKRSLRLVAVLALMTLLVPMFRFTSAKAAELTLEQRRLTVRVATYVNYSDLGKNSTGSEIIKKLHNGDTLFFVDVLYGGLQYYVMTPEGEFGYIFWDEVDFAHPEYFKDLMMTKEALKKKALHISGNYVNMRAGIAGTKDHQKIINYYEGLMDGNVVYYLEKKNNWFKVVTQGTDRNGRHMVGWIYGDFIRENHAGKKWDKYIGGIPADEYTKRVLQFDATAAKMILTLKNQK